MSKKLQKALTVMVIMNIFRTPLIETERLFLTWPSAKQIDQYHNDIINSNMFETIHWDGPKEKNHSGELQDYWRDCSKNNPDDYSQSFELAIIEKSSELYIGGTGLRTSSSSFLNLGYALAPKYHGKGFATEAVKGLVDEAFRKRKAERIFACIFKGNIASRKVAEKAGLSFEGIQRRSSFKNGKWIDDWLLAITRPDWEQQDIY